MTNANTQTKMIKIARRAIFALLIVAGSASSAHVTMHHHNDQEDTKVSSKKLAGMDTYASLGLSDLDLSEFTQTVKGTKATAVSSTLDFNRNISLDVTIEEAEAEVSIATQVAGFFSRILS